MSQYLLDETANVFVCPYCLKDEFHEIHDLDECKITFECNSCRWNVVAIQILQFNNKGRRFRVIRSNDQA